MHYFVSHLELMNEKHEQEAYLRGVYTFLAHSINSCTNTSQESALVSHKSFNGTVIIM